MSKSFIVYCATFPSGKNYIGITSKSLEERIKSHYNTARFGTKGPMQRALLKYSKDEVKWEIQHQGITELQAKKSERIFISVYETRVPKGYNVSPGGDWCYTQEWSPEKRKRICEVKGYEWFHAFDLHTKELLGKWNCTQEASEVLNVYQPNISRCLVEKTVAHKGILFCRESNLHKLDSLFSRSQSNRNRPFTVHSADGNLLGTWTNSNQCARDLNLPTPREIRAVLTSSNRSTYKNLRFNFIQG